MILFVAALIDPPERFAQKSRDSQATTREAEEWYEKSFSQSRRRALGHSPNLKNSFGGTGILVPLFGIPKDGTCHTSQTRMSDLLVHISGHHWL
jgi:hypothetical protein